MMKMNRANQNPEDCANGFLKITIESNDGSTATVNSLAHYGEEKEFPPIHRVLGSLLENTEGPEGAMRCLLKAAKEISDMNVFDAKARRRVADLTSEIQIKSE